MHGGNVTPRKVIPICLRAVSISVIQAYKARRPTAEVRGASGHCLLLIPSLTAIGAAPDFMAASRNHDVL